MAHPLANPKDIAQYGWTPVARDFAAALKGTKPGTGVDVSAIAVPTTPLAKAVNEYATRELPELVYNHSVRVYYYGTIILQEHFPEWELTPETLYITCLLHDIGCTPANLRATLLSFESYGGFIALSLIDKLGGPKAQAEGVAETIIRHQDLGTTGTLTQLGMVIQLATVFDNAGLNPTLITTKNIEDVTALFPRRGWTKCFADTVREEIRLKPWSHTTAIDRFAEKVEGNTLMAPYDS